MGVAVGAGTSVGVAVGCGTDDATGVLGEASTVGVVRASVEDAVGAGAVDVGVCRADGSRTGVGGMVAMAVMARSEASGVGVGVGGPDSLFADPQATGTTAANNNVAAKNLLWTGENSKRPLFPW